MGNAAKNTAKNIEFLEGRKRAPKQLGRVLVLGLGKSGRAAVAYLEPLLGGRVCALSVAAGASSAAGKETLSYAEEMRERGVRVEFDHETIEETYDVCVASPGISQFSPFYESAAQACAEVISEIEFAWRESAADARWVAVTGTNGKTTTASLAAHLLRAAGVNARAVGNIGDTCIEAVAAGNTDVYVAETSSYQLASTRNFAPDVAVLLNITPDHLAWHKSHEAYVAAKLKVLANLGNTQGSLAVLDATNDTVRKTVRKLRALSPEERGFSYVPLGTAAGLGESMRERCGAEAAAYVREGFLHVELAGKDHNAGAVSTLQIKGPHNVANALAAATCAVALGAADEAVRKGLASFKPLEHRIEPCGSVGGVACYNDSKATNVDAALVALASFSPGSIVALFGGRDKGTDLAPLAKRAKETCRAVVLFGESRPRFAEAFSGIAKAFPGNNDFQVVLADRLEDALDAALAIACPKDAILLSPACASFDEFTCFEERGRVFKDLVAKRAARADCAEKAASAEQPAAAKPAGN